jgi:hypothetical protein
MEYIVFVREQDLAQAGPWMLGERKKVGEQLARRFHMRLRRVISGTEDRMAKTAQAIGQAMDVAPSEHTELSRKEGTAFDAQKALRIVHENSSTDVLVVVTGLANIRGILRSLLTKSQRIHYPCVGHGLIFDCVTEEIFHLSPSQGG